ncbi:ABC transporter permease [Actinoplanes xinjiangensis]|uniref:ABC-2 type transport system permease protein n=1 Tax=Actinoplanes xinjiangensis TaxID=512350 RepID=A0A316FLP2_9ACTN|nr:ABC transporter permease [Actinoplanes xinjiangensis]PWK49032.1 ABC-2 type transport system permease protein [Actinoplanes xinjiangensis]GIF38739.1 transport permease protein [Actinoplanes xinjiangensis]
MKTDLAHIYRLARLDLTLIFRNRSALTNAVLMPLAVAAFLVFTADQAGRDSVEYILTGQIAGLLMFAPLVNLAGFYTSRREELVLKRLLGGPASATAILGGSAAGATAVYLLQALAVVIAAVVMGFGLPGNPLLVLVAALGGAAVFALLSMAISGLSSSGELAQLATVPVMLVCLVLSPVIVPAEAFPERLRQVAEYLPLTPVADLVRAGYGAGFAWSSLGLLAAWVAVAALLARRFFRWDPRRG